MLQLEHMSYFSFFQAKTVFVTGGAGFIGSHLCERLLAAGAHVIAIDNFLTGNPKNIAHLRDNPDFRFIEHDMTQPLPNKLFITEQPAAVFHFASPASPPKYQANPIETYLVNSMGTHHLLQAILHHSPKTRFVFASTSEIYGDPAVHPQQETYWGNVNPNGPRSCYDEAKRLGETICGVHHRQFGVDVRIVRIFNTYGPRMDLRDGRVIPNFIQQVLQKQPLTIFGEGTQTRSYCYVDDLVNGVLRLAGTEEARGQTINIGNPEELTILETAQAVQKLAGTDLLLEFKPLPQDDPLRRKPDISLAKKVLEWEPTVPFTEGLRRTLEYFQKA